MPADNVVMLKGRENGIVVFINPEADTDTVICALNQKLTKAKHFFSEAEINILFSGKTLTTKEKDSLKALICSCVPSTTLITFNDSPLHIKTKTPIADDHTEFYHGVVRAGQIITSTGHIVVIGDANPGSELIAGGNIIVMGAARGILHAGFLGNESAFCAANNLVPTQIRIASYVTRCPDRETSRDIIPEIAKISDKEIIIDKLSTKNFKIY